MNTSSHRVHGVDSADAAADWPPLSGQQVDRLLAGFPQFEGRWRIAWVSPRPLSAAALVDTPHGRIFVKRHHLKVRNAACLNEEHSFIAWLAALGLPVVTVFSDREGHTAISQDEWIFEVHSVGEGEDLYRNIPSWTPIKPLNQAGDVGAMLARLHVASASYRAPQRSTHILVARDDLIRAEDPIVALRQQLDERPGLAAYLQSRHWEADFTNVLLPWHAGLAQRLQAEPQLWAHNDLHASNLLWRGHGDTARISTVLDFGLASPTSALFDLATAIERNTIAWLAQEQGMGAAHIDTALALIEGYRQVRQITPSQVHLLADLLPLVHVDFALSELEYFHAITRSPGNAEVAYQTFLLGHAQWFNTPPGEALLQALHNVA